MVVMSKKEHKYRRSDEDKLTEEELKADKEAERDVREGRLRRLEEFLRELEEDR